jgi:DNA polymerase-3 subunit epsilon
MLKLKLDRPLAVFDIEATGVNPRTDRIVELALVRLMPNKSRTTHAFRVNPGIPIPPEATAIHGISDADVAACPPFVTLAEEILKLFEGCDLGGYNVARFDIPLLEEEFLRVGMKFAMNDRRILDAQRIFHKREPRDLTAALAFYCGEMHLDAHGAEADVDATIRVLEGQFSRYSDLPRDMDKLDEYCNPRDPTWVDRTGKLRWHNKEIVLNFGRKKDVPLKELIENDPGFVKWMLKNDFPRDVQDILRNAMTGQWPMPPT